MARQRRNGEWSVVLFVVALLAFNPPVLSIFSVPELIFGIPVLYLYIFLAWGGAIALLATNVAGLIEGEEPPPLRIEGPLPESLPDDEGGAAPDGADGGREAR